MDVSHGGSAHRVMPRYEQPDPSMIFLERHGRVNLRALRTCHTVIMQTKAQHGTVTEDDIRGGLSIGARLSQLETAAHVKFVTDAATEHNKGRSRTFRGGQPVLPLRPDAIRTEGSFIAAITEVMVYKVIHSFIHSSPDVIQ